MNQTLLDIQDLSIDYGSNPVLRHVDLEVRPGQIVGIVGESGSGKTTLARSIMASLPSSAQIVSGSIRFEGQELIGASRGMLQSLRGPKIGMVFQDPRSTFSPVRSIGSQFEEALSVHEGLDKMQAREQAMGTMWALGLEEAQSIYRSYAFELSGGMCQRAAIALAMCLHPKLLIADEPTSALDVSAQVQVLFELKRLKQELGASLIIISHDLRVMANCADELYVMYQGEIVEKGLCHRVLSDPCHAYTKHLIGSVPRFSGKVSK